MNLNKIGIYVKRNLDDALSTLLGVRKKSETELSELHKEIRLTENVHFNKESKKILLEAEAKKNQAIELIRKLQKCYL